MPGLFGALGISVDLRSKLRQEFAAPFPKVESICMPNGLLGGHAFHGSVIRQSNSFWIAVDGEYSIYSSDPASGCGNVAAVNSASCRLTTEWSGTFPLYYAQTSDGMLFCSRLKPLARTLNAFSDPIGIAEFWRLGYTLNGRTLFKGIRRMMPGQAIEYDLEKRQLTLSETSRAWTEDRRVPTEELWDALTKAIDNCCPDALMMSGGWDSRTLFVPLTNRRFLCYSHGDPTSFELRTVEAICRTFSVPFRLAPITSSTFDLDSIHECFERTEIAQFPAWHQAGRTLSGLGIHSIAAGIYGEILGGHYGPAITVRGWRRAAEVLKAFLGLCSSISIPSRPKISEIRHLRDSPDLSVDIVIDFDADLKRLRSRGVLPDRLIEAFVSEHRGSQFIAAQLMSCRASTNVAIPFADQDLFMLASSIPIQRKINNRINQKLLIEQAPTILRQPTSATPFLSARAPLLAQEVCRFIRRRRERSGERYGWINYEFARRNGTLDNIFESLLWTGWNKEPFAEEIKSVKKGHGRPTFALERLLRAYEIDLMLQ